MAFVLCIEYSGYSAPVEIGASNPEIYNNMGMAGPFVKKEEHGNQALR
jgi:hypothetical protein